MTKAAADAHQQWVTKCFESDMRGTVDDLLKARKKLTKLHKKLSRLGGPVQQQ